jgi:hypothetical protein
VSDADASARFGDGVEVYPPREEVGAFKSLSKRPEASPDFALPF